MSADAARELADAERAAVSQLVRRAARQVVFWRGMWRVSSAKSVERFRELERLRRATDHHCADTERELEQLRERRAADGDEIARAHGLAAKIVAAESLGAARVLAQRIVGEAP